MADRSTRSRRMNTRKQTHDLVRRMLRAGRHRHAGPGRVGPAHQPPIRRSLDRTGRAPVHTKEEVALPEA
jgi:hypothetical protein